ncbi:Ig-like domain-containing protein [Gemmatimonas groenlandica]|uniref:OmpA family protein n=1 Tax=Gemmatimonas groenlandica TaxID=2732249 RepID=A0A6M4ISC7_9BACT|nr:Ig-like domain-containing protein [Gemmatimonas groenlandica]QJR35722.1 OmpA family protein [Gemmatimonas groenlandica]
MTKRLIGLSLLTAMAAVPTAQAQSLGERIEVGVFGQYTKIDDKLRIDNVAGIGARAGLSVYKWLGVEGDIQVGSTKANRAPNEDITYRPFRGLATLTVPFVPSKKAALVLGAGYVNSVYSGRSTANEYEEGFSALVGLKLCGSGKWGARLDGIMDNNPSPNEQNLEGTSRNFGVRAGVTYALRGGCASVEQFDWALKIDPATATINRGSNRQFALSAADMKSRPIEMRKVMNLTCSSSDASVATVDNTAKVTAVKNGTATITCKGIVKKIERSASSTVTVPAPAWTLTLTPTSGSADVGKTLSFSSKATDADNVDLGTITWSSANASIASVSNGTVTCNAAGSTTITVTKTAYGTTQTQSAMVTCKALPAARVALDETLFNFDKAVVLKSGMDTLKVVLDAMKRIPSLRISVEGHTDWYGDEGYNNNLAKTRAAAVMATLLKMAGPDAASIKDRIVSSSFGEQCIIAPNGDADPGPPRPRVSAANKAAQAPNRRVEIWQLLDGKGAPTACRSADERAGHVPFGDLK